jgi:hypothetical protein
MDSNFKQQKISRDAACARVVLRRTPEKYRGRREDRVRAAPAVSRANSGRENAHEHTGSAEALRPSLRNGFNGLLRALPGDRACLPPSLADHPASLTPASGCQDHTTSPSATCAVRLTHAVASTASRPALVRWPTPLCVERDGANVPLIWGRDQSRRDATFQHDGQISNWPATGPSSEKSF